MATHIWRDGALYIAGYDLSAISKAFALDTEVEPVDMTVLQQTTRVHAGGLQSHTFTSELLFDGSYDSVLFGYASAASGSEPVVLSFYPAAAAAENEDVFFGLVRPGKFELPHDLGAAMMMRLSGETTGMGKSFPHAQVLTRGKLNARGVGVSATGAGTGFAHGSLASARAALVMAGHVTARTGTAAVVFTLESDDNSGFTTPTTRITESSISAIGQVGPSAVVGAISDTHWRVKYTVSGTGTLDFRMNTARIVLP